MTIKLTSDSLRNICNRTVRASALLTAGAVAIALVGCSQGMPVNTTAVSTPASASTTFHGSVHGGQQPVSAAQIYLYATGTTGYGSASSSLLTSPGYVTTDADGGFSITEDYTCPSSTSLVYIVAIGGDPGNGSNNSLLALMAALGNCQTIKANATFINLNEETTIAAVYALAPFITSVAAIGVPPSNLQGITNAFAEAASLVNIAYGAAYSTTPAGNGIVPYQAINTLANFIAVCVNSSGTVTGGLSTPCDMVMTPETINGVVPTNTIMAALAIAQNPAHSVSSIITPIPPQAPFQPYFNTTPNDFTLAIRYTGGGISSPQAIAVDASGNAWVANQSNAVTELGGGTGTFLSGTSGYTSGNLDAPDSIAIDTNGNAWITNCGAPCSGSANASSVTRLTPASGNTVTASNFIGGGLNGAYALAVDGSNNIWVANALGVSVTEFNSAGVVRSGASGYTATFQSSPTAIAIDAAGNAWTTSASSNAVSELASGGAAGANGYQGTGVSYPFAVAIDSSSRAWVVDQSSNALTVLSGGAPIAGSPFTGGGLSLPNAVALDGSGTAWVSNGSGTLSAFSSTGTAITPATGYTSGAGLANGIAVDGSGSVWVTSCGSYCTGAGSDAGSVYQLIGLATPVVTPLALAEKNGTLALKP